MGKEVKILFTSDLHLGIDSTSSRISDKIRLNTFKKIISLAREHDILLIGGDLIDNSNISPDLADIIREEFTSLRNDKVEVVYTPGEGEINENGKIFPFIFRFNATYFFSNPEYTIPYIYNKEDQRIYFYGVPAGSRCDISKIKKFSDDGFHIGLFHMEFDMNREMRNDFVYRLQKNDIKSLNLDFYALGHNHSFRMFKVMDKIIGAYPGSPEATLTSEVGDRYVVSIKIKDNEIHQIKRLSVNSIKIEETLVDCSEIESTDNVLSILDEKKSKKDSHFLKLSGFRDFVLETEKVDSCRNLFHKFIVIDKSIPTLKVQIEENKSKNNLKGEFYSILNDKINIEDIPKGIDVDNIAVSLNLLMNEGLDSLEDWICNIKNV